MHLPSLGSSTALCLATMAPIAGAQTIGPALPAAPAPEAAGPRIVVAAKRPDVINMVDRTVYRTDADLQATTGTASDILRNIPSVEVDVDGNISLRGDPSVTVLVDGKPSPQMQGAARGSALLSLSAADIEQVEVMTSPSAEFKPDGTGGVINIVTRKNRKKGASGTLLANLGNGGRYNLNAAGSYNAGPLSLGGSIGVREDDRLRDTDNRTTAIDPGTGAATGTHQQLHEKTRPVITSGQANIDYALNDKQALGLSLNLSARDQSRLLGEHSAASGAGNAQYERTSLGRGHRRSDNTALNFKQKLAHDGETLTLHVQSGQTLGANREDVSTLPVVPAGLPALAHNVNQDIYRVSTLAAAYVRPLAAEATLKLGYNAEYDQDLFDNSVASAIPASSPLVPNHAFDNAFRYRQTINALYATYGKKAGKLELLGGLRFEQVNIHTLQQVSGDTSMQSYAKLYPTLNLLYALSEADTVSAGFSKRIARPDPEDLNPYINASDPHNLVRGDPGLKPQETASLEVGYRHDVEGRSYRLTGYYRDIRNSDTDVFTVIGNDVVLQTKANLGSRKSGGMEFIASGKLLPKLGYNLSGNLFYNQINAQSLGIAGTRSNVVLNTKGTLDYQATAEDRWQVSANYNGKRLTPQGYNLAIKTANAGYRHQLNQSAAVVATVSDLFNSNRQRRILQTPGFSRVFERQQYGRLLYVGLAYTLGTAKKAKDVDFSYEQ